MFSERSPLDSNTSSTLGPIESADFLFAEDLSNKLGGAQFSSLNYPFDSFEFNRPVEEKIEDIFRDEQKSARSNFSGKSIHFRLATQFF